MKGRVGRSWREEPDGPLECGKKLYRFYLFLDCFVF